MDFVLEETSKNQDSLISHVENPSWPNATTWNSHVVAVPGFFKLLPLTLSKQESEKCIQIAEQEGFRQASFYTDKDGIEHYSEIRKSSRCIIDSKQFVKTLWERIQKFVPQTFEDRWNVVGINERLRILRYEKGDEFKVHTDGTYVSKEGYHSKITILIYLNDTYEGAFTHILTDKSQWLPIQPHVGMVVLQDQSLLHCVPPLEKGVKYVVRTEVMYKLVNHTQQSEEIKVIKIY